MITPPLFELPHSINKKLLEGSELGNVMDNLTGEKYIKQDGGTIEYFTNGVMNRK